MKVLTYRVLQGLPDGTPVYIKCPRYEGNAVIKRTIPWDEDGMEVYAEYGNDYYVGLIDMFPTVNNDHLDDIVYLERPEGRSQLYAWY